MPSPVKQRPSILVIDDDEQMLGLARLVFDREGYNVDTVKDLRELDKRVHEARKPDVVLIDVNMPEIQGDEVAMMLRTCKQIDAPTFLVSSMDENDLAARAKEAGVTGWMSKSEGMASIAARVRQALQRREQN